MHIAYIILTLIIVLLVTIPYAICCIAAWLLRQWPLLSLGFKWSGICLSAIVAIVFTIAFTYGWRHISVTKYRYSHKSVPETFEGYKIIQLSDFHIGTLSGHPEVVQHIVDSVNALDPDLIVFTGDLVNLHSAEEVEFHEILRGFKANDGIVSVMGNHDYMMYVHGHPKAGIEKSKMTEAQVEDIHKLQDAERDLGWHLLLNDNYIIRRSADSIAIVGVENDGDGKHFPQYADLEKAQRGIAPGTFSILLSHDPTHWRRCVLDETDIPLQLSGHTHAMQFKIFGWSPSRWAYKEWYGEYKHSSSEITSTRYTNVAPTRRTLYVSSGIGEVGVPFRFGAWPEIVEITLYKQ